MTISHDTAPLNVFLGNHTSILFSSRILQYPIVSYTCTDSQMMKPPARLPKARNKCHVPTKRYVDGGHFHQLTLPPLLTSFPLELNCVLSVNVIGQR